ncbi:hypothetical protein KC887_02400 [Candidatus Kaiserbacteria bacterium]|nr:hypothetical protein [Candidatus Kaiserbacteria bacterium]
MAKTRKLNDTGTAWCTTYFGGSDRGRCYNVSVEKDGVKASADLSESELFDLLKEKGVTTEFWTRPGFDS